MKELFIQSITDPLRVACNLLAFVIPYVVYRINTHLHQIGNPPWKSEEE